VRKIPLPKNWKQMTIDDKVASINASRRDEDKLVKMHAMGEEDTIQKAPQLWDLHDRLQKKFENDPHFLRERGDLADILTHRIDADIKVNLEVTDSDRGQMEQDINNKAKELSQEIEMKPVIDEEAARVLREGLAKTQAEAQSLASRNVAARYIHYTELKSGDMKSQAKKSIESAVAGRALRDMTPQHLQAIQNNFKTETINKVMENTFQKMFEGRSDAEARKILDDYYASDPKHARMVHWAATTPAGRELNLPLRRYMTNPNDQATTSIDAYERKQRVREILSRLSPTEKPLERFYNLHIDANKFQNQIEDAEKRIEGLRLRGQSTTIWETKLNSTQQRLDSVLQDIATTHDLEIEPNPNLRRKWEEIETLRRGKPIKEKPPRQPRGPQRGGGGSTTRGGGPTPRGGGPTPRGPAQTPPPPSPSRQPKPPSTPQQPSQQRPPSRSTPTTPAPAPPETPSKGPAWFAAGIESIRGGKIPTIIPKKLENLLHSNGFRRSEINKMKPAEAWAKAEEIIKKEKK